MKRVGNRTFYLRQDHYVEAEVLDVSAEELEKKLVTLHAYGKEYFELLAKHPELGKVLALGDRILFRNGDQIIRILPAAAPVAEKKDDAKK